MSELDEIFPVARIKVFTGEYKLYTDMSELDKEIKEVDVYSKEQVLKLLKPQLTIPKSIADEVDDNGLDSYVIYISLPKDSYLIPEWEPLVDLSDKFIKWCETTEKWWAILDAYLAGKALGVDLVKVVEG